MFQVLAFLIILFPFSANAETKADYSTAGAMLPHCVNVVEGDNRNVHDPFEQGYCIGVVTAVFTSRSFDDICPPNPLTNQEIVAVIVKYIRENPKDLNLPFFLVANAAFGTQYPCAPGKSPTEKYQRMFDKRN